MRSFMTRDLPLASTLCALGYHISHITDHTDGKSVIFAFEDKNGEIREVEQEFVEQKLRVEPHRLFNEMGRLKSWIDQHKQVQRRRQGNR